MNVSCCKRLEDALAERFNDLRLVDDKIVLCQPDLFSRDDDISFCPFCGAKL